MGKKNSPEVDLAVHFEAIGNLTTDVAHIIHHIGSSCQVAITQKGWLKMAAVDTKNSLPILIAYALERISRVLHSRSILYGREGLNAKAMRSDRLVNLLAVVEVLIRNVFFQADGLICHVDKKWARPLCIAEIASWLVEKICYKTVSRCLDDLVKLGLIEKSQIKRKCVVSGNLQVSNSLIRFTPKFWKLLKLDKLFDDSVKWAKEHGTRKLIMPFKTIVQKVKNTCQSAKDLTTKVLKDLSNFDDGVTRVKFHCDRIRAMLKQNKNIINN